MRGPDRLPSSDGERIVDADDRCPALPIECLAGFDDQDIDGCPDAPPLAIGFELGSAAVPSAAGPTLDRIANDARHLARGATLIVVGGAGVHEASDLSTRRARAIVEALLARCVDRERIEISSIGPEDFEGRDPPPNRVVIDTRGCE